MYDNNTPLYDYQIITPFFNCPLFIICSQTIALYFYVAYKCLSSTVAQTLQSLTVKTWLRQHICRIHHSRKQPVAIPPASGDICISPDSYINTCVRPSYIPPCFCVVLCSLHNCYASWEYSLPETLSKFLRILRASKYKLNK